MKLKLFPILLTLFTFQLSAQNNLDPNTFFTHYEEDLSWVKINESQSYAATDFFSKTATLYGIQNARDMKVVRTKKDNLGWNHLRFNQFYNGVKVEGGTYVLHEKDNKVLKANGKIFPHLSINTQPSLNKEEAIHQAIIHHPAEAYLWENESVEKLLQKVRRDENATHYPQPELVILNKNFPNDGGEMFLAYKMDLQLEKPIARYTVYVDAQNGNIIQSFNNLHPTHIDEELIEGTAETRYHGTQTISTTQDANGKYVLRDTSRGVVIETLDSWDDNNIVPFYDDDNYWDNVNARQDEAATDAHYGAQSTYDFYKDNFGRNSYDDNGATLVSRVHVGNNWNNASWNGSFMSYGDGDGFRFNPLTALDVCGHELTHAVTQYSAGLIYRNESGALNESFSDIFGKAIEHAAAPNQFTWAIGDLVKGAIGQPIRSMLDPTLFGDPKYYNGENWHTDQTDNGGVHTNSGVQNYWYYLIVEGGQVVTETGENFTITGMGFEKANAIAYRNLTEYLTEVSQYEDARIGSLEAATDLYGFCSEEYVTVSQAWAAVGIGYEIRDGDYLVEAMEGFDLECDLTEFDVQINVLNNGCNDMLAAGTTFPVSYQIDGEPMVTEMVSLTQALDAGGSFTYTFNEPAVIDGFGEHLLKVWATPPGDVRPDNNALEINFLNRPYQNDDFGLLVLRDPGGVCSIDPVKPIIGSAAYYGCDSLAPSDVPFKYFYKGTTFEGKTIAFLKLAPFDEVPLEGSIYFTEFGFDNGTFTIEFPDDSNAANNSGTFYLARLEHLEDGWMESFSATGLDSAHLAIYKEQNANSAIQVFDDYSYIMTGSDIFNAQNAMIVKPRDTPEGFLRANETFVTTMDICLDLNGMDNPYLSFDLAQTRSNFDYAAYNIDPNYSTMLGVFIDGQQIGPIIYGGPNNGEFLNFEYDLNLYKVGTHHLELRALGLTASISNNGNIEVDGDNNIVDFIEIKDKLDVSVDNAIPQNDLLDIAPNPSMNTFTISRKDGKSFTNEQIQVFDAAGKLHYSETLKGADRIFTFGEDLVPGIYFVKTVNGMSTGFSKIVKQ